MVRQNRNFSRVTYASDGVSVDGRQSHKYNCTYRGVIAMKIFTYSQARQALSTVLDTARKERVLITRRGGETFAVTYEIPKKSPFDVPGIETNATTRDILEAVRNSRARGSTGS